MRGLRRTCPDSATAVLRVTELAVDLAPRRVLEDVRSRCPAGVVVGLVGPNGAGKTTLLRAIAGTRPAAAGTVEAPARDRLHAAVAPAVLGLSAGGARRRPAGLYRRTGWLRLPSRAERRRATEALESVGMQGFERRQIGQLSGGQRQRVLLARTLVQDAELVLLDEPMTGVDVATAGLFLETLGTPA